MVSVRRGSLCLRVKNDGPLTPRDQRLPSQDYKSLQKRYTQEERSLETASKEKKQVLI